jgi:hypothetical protein
MKAVSNVLHIYGGVIENLTLYYVGLNEYQNRCDGIRTSVNRWTVDSSLLYKRVECCLEVSEAL